MSFKYPSGQPLSTRMRARRPVAIRLARTLSQGFTWGLPAAERTEHLAEMDADWEAMQAELGSVCVILRALRGGPAWLWDRLTARDTTALPAATAVTLVAMGALSATFQPAVYPLRMRLLAGMTAAGMLLVSITLLRTPRRLVARRLGLPALITTIGIFGLAFDLPPVSAWRLQTPVLDHWTVNGLIQTALLTIGMGCALISLNALIRSKRILVVAGAFIVLGLMLFATSQIIWGVWATSVDLQLALSSLVMGLAALSWSHVMPRLRHLDFE